MQIKIPYPKYYELYYGSSELVCAYLDRIEKTVGEVCISEAIDILRISLLIAPPEELEQGKFMAYERYDWRCGYVSVGVNGDFRRYHLGDDMDKILVLSEMLQTAFELIGKKRKAKFSFHLANEIVNQITGAFMEKL